MCPREVWGRGQLPCRPRPSSFGAIPFTPHIRPDLRAGQLALGPQERQGLGRGPRRKADRGPSACQIPPGGGQRFTFSVWEWGGLRSQFGEEGELD